MGSEEKYKNIFNNKKEREKFKVSHFECFGKKQLTRWWCFKEDEDEDEEDEEDEDEEDFDIIVIYLSISR